MLKKPLVFDFPLLRMIWPPTYPLRQFASIAYFSYLVGWRHFYPWLLKHSFPSIPVAAGAIGMGCIGFPAHPVFEVTGACNLRCVHCHATSGKAAADELTTVEAKKLIDGIAAVSEFRMLVFTGGEPLVRHDLYELLEHSKKRRLINVIATNGTLIDDQVARDLRQAGVSGVAISLDSSDHTIHNQIRAHDEAFSLAMRGIKAVKNAGMLLQINTTAMEYNFDDLGGLIELAEGHNCSILLMYQLVPVGRGLKIEAASLHTNENEKLLRFLADKQKTISAIVEPVAGPQYWPYLMERKNRHFGFWKKAAEKLFFGCTAARGFVYIKANGDIWPCPFIEASAGNVRERSFPDIWRDAEIFKHLRERNTRLKGKCGECRYRTICGGCRGRAMAYSSDYLAEDPSCFLERSQCARSYQ